MQDIILHQAVISLRVGVMIDKIQILTDKTEPIFSNFFQTISKFISMLFASSRSTLFP